MGIAAEQRTSEKAMKLERQGEKMEPRDGNKGCRERRFMSSINNSPTRKKGVLNGSYSIISLRPVS
jgi:hypothetical protein